MWNNLKMSTKMTKTEVRKKSWFQEPDRRRLNRSPNRLMILKFKKIKAINSWR